MKRHESIVPLSREHHAGLLCSWKIKQGLKRQIATERIALYIIYFFEKHLVNHFLEEETILFVQSDDARCKQALYEHTELAHLMQTIKEKPQSILLQRFADVLEAHIRFEERILFPFLEQSLEPHVLAEIGEQIAKANAADEPENYADEFWR